MKAIPEALKRHTLLTAILLAFNPLSASAFETELIKNNHGDAVFEMRVYGPQDDQNHYSFAIDENGRAKMKAALERWANILKPGQYPGIIKVEPDENYPVAAASSPFADDPLSSGQKATLIQLLLNNQLHGADLEKDHAYIHVGNASFDTNPVTPSQLPLANKLDLSAVMVHEMAHALGISGTIKIWNAQGNPVPPYFDGIDRWAAGLRDDNGNAAKDKQQIMCEICDTPYSSQAFDLRQNKGYFTGVHVQEVLNGGLPGIPVSLYRSAPDREYTPDLPFLAHTELRNSLMSHQNFRNYTSLMEAEIAALQDMGLQIDRRNFFGYSVYGNGLNLTNTHGFFARNAEGTDYLPGTYNQSYQGLGLHIYGERNMVTQQADLLSAGDGGIGVRIDGSQSTLVVPEGTRIHAQGWYGRGIQVSYGRDQNIVQRGEVRADGQDGVGALFDFGTNANLRGDENDEYRGSWMRTIGGKNVELPDELKGALINNYDLTGTIAGKSAAIRISDNAWVQNIHVMQGAHIEGDIVSAYDKFHPVDGSRMTTRLSFGQLADAQGKATAAADPHFQMRYDGNIRGATSFDVVMAGGSTSLNGSHELHSLHVQPGATLMGNSSYSIHPEGVFANDGILRQGNSIGTMQITGNFVQGASGTMVMEATTSAHDRIAVQGNAELGGELRLQLQPDWYASGWKLPQDQVFSATQRSGAFDRITADLASPTLSVLSNNSGWTVLRNSGSYARYAANPNAAAVGRGLENAGADAQRPLAPIYQAIDFSRPDGSDVRSALDQLGTGAYGAQLAASMRREQLVSEQLRLRKPGSQAGWEPFVQVYGGTYRWQLGANDVDQRSNSYSLLMGADQQVAGSDWRWGAHGSVTSQRVSMSNNISADARMDALAAGLHAMYRPDANEGWTALGQMRVGMEDGRLNRQQYFAGYKASPSSNWTGYYMTAGLQSGYLWQLGSNASVGPVLGLDYLHYRRPSLTEGGGAVSRLGLDAANADSLQASLGVALRHRWEPSAGRRLQTQLSATWEQALLGGTQSQSAYFAASPTLGFDSQYARVNRHALALRAGLNYMLSDKLSMDASLATRVRADSRAEFSGNVALNWRF